MNLNDETRRGNSNELILNPNEYAFLQDNTKGNVQTFVGPIVITQTGQHRPISFSNGRFVETSLQNTVNLCVEARKGEYLILSNPTVDDNGLKHPEPASNNAGTPSLRLGEKIVVPGPVQFALWPQQEAKVVKGHDLRDDQFLVVRVYDEDAAVANWSHQTVVASDSDDDDVTSKTAEELGLTLGQLLVIKGVSFYIPCTGVEVVANEKGEFVRDALTLEMSEYAILIDQSGNKRYERGPQIVFPEPTEEFFEEQGHIKFRPIELTPKQGLHIKINCDYSDDQWPQGARVFSEGEEIFITGETHPIYYPREEHSLIKYGNNIIHYATAVPAGQARYVMNKHTGQITTVEGPDMLLLDPTKEVFAKRSLSDNEVLLMYPGNTDALEYNRSLRQFQVSVESDVITNDMLQADYGEFERQPVVRSFSARASRTALPDQMERKTSYTEPHSVVLNDNRFDGVPTLKIWTGFAVLLVQADGSRRVEIGPKTVKLGYDETVQALHLSTGKPKTTDKLLTTGYLEIANNKVSDIIDVETEDGVSVRIKVSYRVSFTGDPETWFNIDNYVKFLCDNARSRLKGAARHFPIREFYKSTVDIVRDTLLGEKVGDQPREGLLFKENGMILTDVDLLSVNILSTDIEHLLLAQQQAVVTDQIAIDRAKQEFQVATAKQKVAKETMALEEELRQTQHELSVLKFNDEVYLADLKDNDNLARVKKLVDLNTRNEEAKSIQWDAELERKRQKQALEIELAQNATDQIIARFKACEGDLARAINNLGDTKVLETLAESMGPMQLIGDVNLGTLVAGLIGSASQKSELFNRLNTLVNTDEN